MIMMPKLKLMKHQNKKEIIQLQTGSIHLDQALICFQCPELKKMKIIMIQIIMKEIKLLKKKKKKNKKMI